MNQKSIKSTESNKQRHQMPADNIPDNIPENTPENTPENIPDNPPADANAQHQTADENADGNNESAIDVSADDSSELGGEEAQDAKAEDSKKDLIEKLIAAHSQIDELKDDYIRVKAEMENIRRRSQNEMVSARKYAIEGFAQELLIVVDSLEQAARVEMDMPNGEAANSMTENMKKGLELTLKQFDTVMEKFGVIAVEAESGVKFNPEVHQAISVIASDEVEPEHIVNVMQKGFSLKDRLLRPAMVVIAKSPE